MGGGPGQGRVLRHEATGLTRVYLRGVPVTYKEYRVLFRTNRIPMRRICIFALLTVTSMIAAARSIENVEYSHPGATSLQMDGYVPDGAGPFPAVIIVHGGAWVTGDRRRSVQPLFAPLEQAGFAWFSISYRLVTIYENPTLASLMSSASTLSDAVTDVRSAVSYVRRHAAELRVDANNIALIGESAGAQLASTAALRRDPSDPGNAVRGVIAFYGPSDLVKLVQTTPQIPDGIRQAVRGSPLEQVFMAGLRELSPVNWVRKDAAPFLLIHGTADRLVPLEQSQTLCDALNKAGAQCELFTVKGGHGLRWWDDNTYRARMIDWLKSDLGK